MDYFSELRENDPPEVLEQLVHQLLTTEHEERDEVEEKCEAFTHDRKHKLLYDHFKNSAEENKFRVEALTQLRLHINRTWKGYATHEIKRFCAELFEQMQCETEPIFRMSLAGVIGAIVRQMKGKWGGHWEAVEAYVQKHLGSDDLLLQMSALTLAAHAPLLCTNWASLGHIDLDRLISCATLRPSVLSALITLIKYWKTNQMLSLPGLTAALLKIAFDGHSLATTECDHCTAIDGLYDLARDFTPVMKRHIGTVYFLCVQIIREEMGKTSNADTAQMMLTALSPYIYIYADSFPKNLIPAIMHASLLVLVTKVNEEEDDDSRSDIAVSMGGRRFKEVIYGLGARRTDAYLMPVVIHLLQDDDWKKRAAALVGMYSLERSLKMSETLLISTTFLADTHPRVRHYSCLLMINLLNFYWDELEEKHFDSVFSALIRNFDEKDERVTSRAMVVVDVLTSDCTENVLAKHYDVLMPRLTAIIRSSSEKYKALRKDAFKSVCNLEKAVDAKKFNADFFKIYHYYLDGNTKHILSNAASIDVCFACYERQSNVVIRKIDTCGSCACRCIWCSDCFARIHIAAIASDSTVSCPTCRADFCMDDVLFVRDEAE